MAIVYHYSGVKFKEFDLSKCDGFWFTTVSPENFNQDDIGANDCKFVAVCDIDFDNSALNETAYDVEEFFNDNTEFDAIENRYDNGEIEYINYCLIDNSKIKILEWIQL